MQILEGKIAIVTGAARGNGAGIARGFSLAGAKVYSLDINEGCDSSVIYYKVDLCDTKHVEDIINEIYVKEKKVDILVNNAGVSVGNPSELYGLEDWNKTITINLSVPFVLSQLIAGKWIANNQKGCIINITSLGAEFGFPNNPAYCASKGGLKQLTKAFAYDWGKYGIRVNNVGPGYIRTHMTNISWNNPVLKEERDKHIMLGRWGEPNDLSGICVFLASDGAEYITGQDIYVDGGWTAKGL